MAARICGLFDEETKKAVLDSKILVVGAGGIGCELLKNLVLSGFEDIHVIDLDTIDVSNLNRQFLFQKQHVGKSKAVVAKESAQRLNPKAQITAYHDSVTNQKYGVDFFKQFSAVTNALDNMAARSHVNRMCLAANIPLIESGSAGYLGQVTVYKKGITECYECLPKSAPKTFPGCTIRNTPSQPIHCVVWAKHLFNQLFGEEDADEEVSPDAADKENANSEFQTSESGNVMRISTREWAKRSQYDAVKLFKKLFHDDIQYLLSMTDLWTKRVPPSPLEWDDLPDAVAGSSRQTRSSIRDQELWSIKECASIFQDSVVALKKRVDDPDSGGMLVWDKDDKHCMDFVAACANIRAYCFGIPQKSRFVLKSMAGNIIPAIATTNAIIGGLIVLQLLKVLKGETEKCRTVILSKCTTSVRKNLLTCCELEKPNPKCFACSSDTPEVDVRLNVETLTVRTLEEKILIERLNMIAPDVVIDDGKGTILISSDPEEKLGTIDKTLANFGISYGTRLQCDDFVQRFKLVICIDNSTSMADQEFEVISDSSYIKPEQNNENDNENDTLTSKNEPEVTNVDVEDDISVVEFASPVTKRKITEDENGMQSSPKKARIEIEAN